MNPERPHVHAHQNFTLAHARGGALAEPSEFAANARADAAAGRARLRGVTYFVCDTPTPTTATHRGYLRETHQELPLFLPRAHMQVCV